MAKTPSDKLYRLIHGLSPAEKRYFRIFIRGKTDRESKYLQLFEAIDAQAVFDETALQTKIYKNRKPEGKKFSELKGYLYDLVLKSLQNFDENQSVEGRISQYLLSLEALNKRGHYADCLDLLQKAERLAVRYELFSQQLEILRWKKQIAYTRIDVDFLYKNLDQLNFEENLVLERLQNLATYRQAFFEIYLSIKKDAQNRNENPGGRLRELIQSDLFEGIASAKSHKARVYYLRGLNLAHYAALEYEAFYESGKNLIALLESQPHFLELSLSDYIAALSNHLLASGLLHKYEEVEECLHKFRRLRPITEDDRRKIHRQYYSSYFAFSIYMGKFEEARLEIARCQADAAEIDPKTYETTSFLLQFCIIAFGCNDYNAALDYLNQWTALPRTVEREDLQSILRVVALIIHYEMQNWALLESLLRSATRFMQKKNRLFDLERRFMQFIQESLRAPGNRERQDAFRKMKADLQTLAQQAGTRALLQTFDLEAWLDAKIKGISFSEATRLKTMNDER